MITVECLLSESRSAANDQGNRPTCLAFAIATLNRKFAPQDLGPEYFYRSAISLIPGWCPGQGLNVAAAKTASALGHPIELDYPYQPAEPTTPLEALPTGLTLYGRAVEFYKPNISRLMSSLQAGEAVGLALRLTREFFTPTGDIIGFSNIVLPGTMIHAVVVVGMGYDEHQEPWFLIRNSWGAGWGANGYAWLSSTYVTAHASCAFGVEHGSSV
ncbi:C1 family peptidase [Pseudomonas sp. B21-009]|uniref:C1 family peptidase n=1 Tax=Pseudomonas sp. B21-009 TaxID=2895470 RepID=UPI00215FFD67|nr:C1 family peptidase [Pseudomonas sp. B21-009]UVM66795.1 C1 family peptidase [Pseudomonas sp. B21-009]